MNNNELSTDLFEALALLNKAEEIERFIKDLCTPQEIKALADRWRVCKLLHQDKLSYREIHAQTGVSLATITRVARFLNTEPHHGYKSVLKKIESITSNGAPE
ncbi:MAG TPA: YerC/YecD family TrpR-related protein [Candidatus Babeliales bacterium]|nr:YerC/YecD family TrpR-related protein [Candidatus Babeliales bacterium]